ncbi:unnamed protein product, partial [Scytosiphon promiscuus]
MQGPGAAATAVDYCGGRGVGQRGAGAATVFVDSGIGGQGRRGLATMVEEGRGGTEAIARSSASISLEPSEHAASVGGGGGGDASPLVAPREDVDHLLRSREGKDSRGTTGTKGVSAVVAEAKDGAPHGDASNGGGGGGDGDGVTAAAKAEKPGTDGGVSGAGSSSSFLNKCNKDLKAFARAGEVDKAIALLARMREAGVPPTSRSYTSAINACKSGVSKQWKQALALLKEVTTVGSGVEPNAFHYTAAIKACGAAHRWDEVGLLEAEMETRGIVPGLPYYHWTIKGVAARSGRKRSTSGGVTTTAAGDDDGAATSGAELLREIVGEMARKGVVPNRSSYSLVEQVMSRLSGEGTGGDEETERVMALLRGIEGAPEPLPPPPPPPPSSSETTEKGEAAAAAPTETAKPSEGRAKKASKANKKKEDRRPLPGDAAGSPRDGAAASAKTRASPSSGKGGGAGKGLGSLRDCNRTLRRLSGRGDGSKATALIASMRDAGMAPTDKTYTSAMNACRQGGQWREALALLKSASSSEGVTINEYHYAAAIRACGNGHQWDRIPALVADMESRGLSASTDLYNWAIKAVSSTKSGSSARSILTRDGAWRTPHRDETSNSSSSSMAEGTDTVNTSIDTVGDGSGDGSGAEIGAGASSRSR